MIYKPERVVDLESGAIVLAPVRAGDAADSEGAAGRLLEAVGALVEIAPEASIEDLAEEAAGDEGYFALAEIAELQRCGIKTVFADPQESRRRKDLPAAEKQALERARQAVQRESGKALLRQRGQHVERAFCHLLDHGGLRRATLKGLANLSKRYLMGALTFNLSLLLRTLFGIGTPKQWLAAPRRAVLAVLAFFMRRLAFLWQELGVISLATEPLASKTLLPTSGLALLARRIGSSTGC